MQDCNAVVIISRGSVLIYGRLSDLQGFHRPDTRHFLDNDSDTLTTNVILREPTLPAVRTNIVGVISRIIMGVAGIQRAWF